MSLGSAGSIYPSKPGKLYAWGSTKGNKLPGLNGDRQGHLCFPERILKKSKILQVRSESSRMQLIILTLNYLKFSTFLANIFFLLFLKMASLDVFLIIHIQ